MSNYHSARLICMQWYGYTVMARAEALWCWGGLTCVSGACGCAMVMGRCVSLAADTAGLSGSSNRCDRGMDGKADRMRSEAPT